MAMKRQGIAWAAAAALGIGAACAVASRKEIAPAGSGPSLGAGGKVPAHAAPATSGTRWTTAVEPKPLNGSTEKGLAWLVEHQQQDGGWAQGEEGQAMRGENGQPLDRSNVADTCMAALALVRAGSTPAAGRHAAPLERAVAFVCSEVEASPADSLSVTSVHGTRVQAKIGTYVDTFAASMLLAEVKGRMEGSALNARVDAALDTVLAKIARHQKQDGGWEGQGWAPILSQSLGGKGINRASQAGVNVDAELLARTEMRFAGPGDAVPSSAGVALYAEAGSAGNAQDFVNTSFVKERALRDKLEGTKDAGEREQVLGQLKKLEEGRAAFDAQQDGLVQRLDDPQFVSGFGSNGGEEFLSYMNISESLVVRADDAWRRWDQSMATNLARVQNEDGSWTGHHCITGRTFCTASALLVLLADRAPVPVEVVAARG
jgi:hypothetical protein